MIDYKTEQHFLIVLFAFFLLIICFSTQCFGDEIQQVTDTSFTRRKVDSLLLSFDSLIVNQPQEAEVYINSAMEYSKAINYKKGIAKCLIGLGNLMTRKENFKEAHNNYIQGIELVKTLDDKKLLFQCYKTHGNLFYSNGFYEDALINYMTAMAIAEGENFLTERIIIYNNIGLVYGEQKSYEKAKQYIKKALLFDPPLEIRKSIFNNLGIQYFRLIDYDSAFWCYQQSLKICDELNSEVSKAGPLSNIGEIYYYQQKYTEGLDCLFRAKEIYDQMGIKQEQIPVLSTLGRIFQNIGDYKNSIKYFKEGMAYAKESNNPLLIYKLHFNLAWAYKEAGQFDLSWNNISEFQKIRDSIVSFESNRRIENLLAKFEIDQKEKEIKLLNKEKELQVALLAAKQSEVERHSQIRNITIISSFIIVIPILVLLIVYQQKIKANELLSLRNEEINKQKIFKLIRDHEIKNINTTIEAQEKERKRIASDLHDGIGGTLAGIKLNLVKVKKEIGGQKLQNIINKVDDTCQEIRNISHHLMPLKILQSSFVEMIKYYLEEIAQSNSLKLSFCSYPKNMINQLSDETKIEVYRILQELVNNIIKHAHAKHIDVQITGNSGYINILFEDSGIGFDTSKTYQGIGLNNIQSRVRLLKGDFNIDSAIGRGTIVNIDIPIDSNFI